MHEVWKPVPSHDLLEASSLGRIRSRPYAQAMPKGGERVRFLSPTAGQWAQTSENCGRMQVLFRRRTFKVARLVCEAFHGPPPPGKPNVLHRDEDSMNNCPGNLRWGTQKENLNAPGFIAYCKSRVGEANPLRKGMRRRSKVGKNETAS